MTLYRATDSVLINNSHRRSDGYLVVDARIARTGIQRYSGIEVGKPDLEYIDVYRPEGEVFSKESMGSFAHQPLTNDHPEEFVNSKNWKKYAIGQTSDQVARDGEFIRVPMMIADQDMIDNIENGKRELSAGYTCDLRFEEGVTPNGEKYNAIQTNIRANHIAVVEKGRAGKQCSIGDSDKPWNFNKPKEEKENKMTEPAKKTVIVDGLSVVTTDQGAQAIEKLMKDRDTVKSEAEAKIRDLENQIQAKDAEIAKKDAEIDDVKGKILDQKAIGELVAKRANLEVLASKIDDSIKPAGLTDDELRKAVVVAKLGEDKIAGKTQAYIDARFDILADEMNSKSPANDHAADDPFRHAMRRSNNGIGQNAFSDRDAAFRELTYFDQNGCELKK